MTVIRLQNDFIAGTAYFLNKTIHIVHTERKMVDHSMGQAGTVGEQLQQAIAEVGVAKAFEQFSGVSADSELAAQVLAAYDLWM